MCARYFETQREPPLTARPPEGRFQNLGGVFRAALRQLAVALRGRGDARALIFGPRVCHELQGASWDVFPTAGHCESGCIIEPGLQRVKVCNAKWPCYDVV